MVESSYTQLPRPALALRLFEERKTHNYVPNSLEIGKQDKRKRFINLFTLLTSSEGTIRKDFAVNIEKNSTHGSDAPDTAAFEISYFFSETEILS